MPYFAFRPLTGVSSCCGAGLLAGMAVLLGVSGCSPMQATVTLEGPVRVEGPSLTYTGTFISDRLFDAIEVGIPADLLVAMAGEPDRRTTLASGREVWVYRYAPAEQTQPLFEVMDESEDDPLDARFKTRIFIFENGRLIDKVLG